MISVALCTYNGGKYIEKQLSSILAQIHPVDEIIICDDCSTDNTLQVIETISQKTSVIIRCFKNEKQLGSSQNFNKAIGLCRGDIILLSDQDDIWLENKVQVIVDWFNANPYKSVVFSDAHLIDDNDGLMTDKTLWDCIGFSLNAQKYFKKGFGIELFSYENRATGATMAIRRDFAVASHFIDICNEYVLHDGALAILALATDALGFIPEILTRYRCHGNQAVGIGETMNHPLCDNPRATSSMSIIWTSRPLPTALKQRVETIELRHRMVAQRMGLIKILKNYRLYKKFYFDCWGTFLHYDISRWMSNFLTNESLHYHSQL